MSSPEGALSRLRLPELNPVLAKEVRERVRSPKATVILVLYLLVMGGVLYLSYRFGQTAMQRGFLFSPYSQLAVPSLGRLMFELLVLLLLILVAFIAPAISAGAIASERERRTLSLLQMTLLRPISIVFGKVSASISFILLLVLATIPLFTIPLVLGGMNTAAILKGFIMILAISLFVAAMGTWASSVHRRTQFAAVSAYALVFFYFAGTFLAWGAEATIRQFSRTSGNSPYISVYFNPITATASAVATGNPDNFSPLSSMARAIENRSTSSQPFSSSRATTVFKVWTAHLAVILLLSSLFLFLAARRLRAPVSRFRLRAKGGGDGW